MGEQLMLESERKGKRKTELKHWRRYWNETDSLIGQTSMVSVGWFMMGWLLTLDSGHRSFPRRLCVYICLCVCVYVCLHACTWVFVAYFCIHECMCVCVCVRMITLCSDSHYCGLCSVFKAQTTVLWHPEVLLVQQKFFFFFSSYLVLSLFSLPVCFCWRMQTQMNIYLFSLLASVKNINAAHAVLCIMKTALNLSDKMYICEHSKPSWYDFFKTLNTVYL